MLYSGTSLKRTLTGQKFLSGLERCPPWKGLNWKVPKFKVRLFYTGPTLTRTPPPLLFDYGNVKWWERSNFFCNVSVHLTSKVKVVSYFLSLSISDHNVLQLAVIIMSCSLIMSLQWWVVYNGVFWGS